MLMAISFSYFGLTPFSVSALTAGTWARAIFMKPIKRKQKLRNLIMITFYCIQNFSGNLFLSFQTGNVLNVTFI